LKKNDLPYIVTALVAIVLLSASAAAAEAAALSRQLPPMPRRSVTW
jgi:hypothetical protein